MRPSHHLEHGVDRVFVVVHLQGLSQRLRVIPSVAAMT